MSSSVLIAGAGGYIGGRLAPVLADHGFDVRRAVLHASSAPSLGEVVVDLARQPEAVREACHGAPVIVHLAGANEVLAASDPPRALRDTVLATMHLADAARAVGARRIVYMSTVHVYGDRMHEGAVLTEDLRPDPLSTYAIARLASEHVLAGAAADGLEVVVFRLTNSVGAPAHPKVDRWTLVVNDLSRQGARTGQLKLHSTGAQWRDFVALADVCEIIAAACKTGDGAIPAGVYNLGSGKPMTIRAIAGLVMDAFERQTGARPPLRAPDPPESAPGPYFVSVDRLNAAGIRAETPVDEAVDEIVRFSLYHRDEL